MTSRNASVGYGLAAAAACISGVSVFVNALGVRAFADPVVYTSLKDGFVGILLLMPLCFSYGRRAEYRRLDASAWVWLVALALTGGSVPFALFYSGLQATTAATGALINHFQFVLVALFAAVFLKERVRPAVWAGMLVLLIGSVLGTRLDTLQWNAAGLLIVASTVLFAIDFVIAKYLLRELSTLTVMTARMTLGTAGGRQRDHGPCGPPGSPGCVRRNAPITFARVTGGVTLVSIVDDKKKGPA